MGPTGCPETSARNYHYSLHNNPEERNSHPHQLVVSVSLLFLYDIFEVK
jgi:hypothetical protein